METKMLSITDGDALECVLCSDLPPNIKELLGLRLTQLAEDQPQEDLHELARFAVVEPGDTAADLEQTISFSIFQNPADGSRFGELHFSPGWEWIQDHGFAYELCFIMDDSGFGHVVIIPKQEGVSPELLDFCRQYASENA